VIQGPEGLMQAVGDCDGGGGSTELSEGCRRGECRERVCLLLAYWALVRERAYWWTGPGKMLRSDLSEL
jgi:hypothetical protein